MADRDALYVLGINAYDHDVAACLLKDGEIVAAIAKERLTRVKHDTGFYAEVVDYCLDAEGIDLDRVDLVVRNSYILPVTDMEERLVHHHLPFYLSTSERELAKASSLFLTDAENVFSCSHHLAHAYSAFARSGFDEGAIMVVDGIGSYRADVVEAIPAGDSAPDTAREAESYYRFSGRDVEALEKVWLPPTRGLLHDEFPAMPGLGALYSRVSTYVFGDWNRCGEVMGLAPYGRLPAEPLATLRDGVLDVPAWGKERAHPFLGGGDGAWASSAHRPEWEDLARRVQEDTEEILLERARRLHERTGSKNLCLAGGVALNCVANGRLLAETPFENVFITPAAGDDGIALGCAYYGHLALCERDRPGRLETACLGRTYGEEEVGAAVDSRFLRLGATQRRPPELLAAVADLLAGGAILGFFQGGSEFGPRALGNRSILADPRDPKMKDRLNERVKHRQPFRPFAPIVMAERASEYFEGAAESPFMLLVKRVRPEARDRIPSIVHVDGTARVQTVRREQNPRLYALLEAFEARTGVPVLLNTSFNDRGMPIVETPEDAVGCFLTTRLDALVLRDLILEKRHFHRALFPVFRFLGRWRDKARTPRALGILAESYLGH